MEQIHGVDVSWMTHGSSKDKPSKSTSTRRRNTLQSQPTSPPLSISPSGSPRSSSPLSSSVDSAHGMPIPSRHFASPPSPIPESPLPSSPPSHAANQKLQRRPSWFSNISSRFSSNPSSSPPPASNTAPKQTEPAVPRANPNRNAVLQHAAKYEGEGPYIPAPPKSSGQTGGLFHVLRRLSSSAGTLGPAARENHGLVERKILNVDQNRERCKLPELNAAKLRRVAFFVDVEIAPMPKYVDQEAPKKVVPPSTADGIQKQKAAEKSEGEALKNAAKSLPLPDGKDATKSITASLASSLTAAAPALSLPTPSIQSTERAAASDPTSTNNSPRKMSAAVPITAQLPQPLSQSPTSASPPAADPSRKKEKKKKSEEERKARKERKRRLAEANGTIPMEIYVDSEESEEEASPATATKTKNSSSSSTPRAQLAPTTNPVRIYRRCCQLRETPILKKIVEQLSDPLVTSAKQGVVNKLDLTGYWMQLADLVTLGDFLAIVPVRELIVANCGLNDEGVRVILAGLLAARKPEKRHIHMHHFRHHAHSIPPHDGHIIPAVTAAANGLASQGGFVERLVLKNNKLGVDGWKYVCLFVYLCHSLKVLDLSNVIFPVGRTMSRESQQSDQSGQQNTEQTDVCQLLAKSIGERLGGSTLELMAFADTGLSAEQLGWLVDGIIRCGTKRLGLAHNDLDDAGVEHVARYLASGKCEGLDLGGIDLQGRVEQLAEAAATNDSLWALSLADCNLTPSSLCKLLPRLAKLPNFRFLDLSHNHALFETTPNATPILRRYLPLMESLKRLHLADVAMTSKQAIAIAEVLPEVKELAHLNIQQNPELSKLANARTEETQEQACALYASFLAATRLSTSIVVIDMAVPTPESSEIVRAMAKQVLAYCLRNVDRVTLGNAAVAMNTNGAPVQPRVATADAASDSTSSKSSTIREGAEYADVYPDVIQHLVGHDVSALDEEDDVEAAPDDDYVIGGTGVAQALECCLNNRGSEADTQPDGFVGGATLDTDGVKLPSQSKAKDMSKHLLLSARKIRLRIQPALLRAKALSGVDNQAYLRLLFLDNTLDGIIKRFEEEFPETRVSIDGRVSSSSSPQQPTPATHPLSSSADSGECEADTIAAMLSEDEDETDILAPKMSRTSSVMSLSSKGLTNEEGRVLRAGHRLRNGLFKHYSIISGVEDIESDPKHSRVLYEVISDINDPGINKILAEKGIVRLFKEDRNLIMQVMKEQDPEDWERFMEAQDKARANIQMNMVDGRQVSGGMVVLGGGDSPEEAIVDDASVDSV